MMSKLPHNITKFYLYKFLRGLWIPASIWALYFLAIGFDYTQIGITEIVFSLVVILLEIPSGAFADLIGRRPSVVLGYAIFGISLMLLGWFPIFHLVVMIMIVMAIGESLSSGADNALVYDTLKALKREKQYTQIDGRANAIFSTGSVVGSFIGAWLFTLNIAYPWFIGGVLFIITGLSFTLMQEPNVKREKYSIKRHWQQVVEGSRYARSHPAVRWIIAFWSLILGLFGFQIFIVSPALEFFGFPVKYFGLLFTLIWGLEAVVFWNASRIIAWLGEHRTFFFIAFLMGACFLALSMVRFWLGLAFIIISYWMRGLLYPISNNFIQRHIPTSHRATTLSVQNSATALLALLLTFLYSRSADLIGIQATYGLVGIAVVCTGLVMLLTFPKRITHSGA